MSVGYMRDWFDDEIKDFGKIFSLYFAFISAPPGGVNAYFRGFTWWNSIDKMRTKKKKINKMLWYGYWCENNKKKYTHTQHSYYCKRKPKAVCYKITTAFVVLSVCFVFENVIFWQNVHEHIVTSEWTFLNCKNNHETFNFVIWNRFDINILDASMDIHIHLTAKSRNYIQKFHRSRWHGLHAKNSIKNAMTKMLKRMVKCHSIDLSFGVVQKFDWIKMPLYW